MEPEVKRALTEERAWLAAWPPLRAKCLPHIEDAQRQIMEEVDANKRRVMLSRLPPHIRDIVRERLSALWVGDGWGYVVYATDNSEDGYHDACTFLGRCDDVIPIDAIRRLPLSNMILVVTKKAPE